MSDRGFSSTIQTSLSASRADLALLVFLDWPGGAARFWSGVGDITYSGDIYTGVGELGSLDKVADSLDKTDIGVNLRLNYLDDDIRNEVVTNDPRGSDASIYLADVDTATITVNDAYEWFPGIIDQVEIVDEGKTGAVIVRIVSELSRLRKKRMTQLTDAHQQWLFVGDKGLEFAPKMHEVILWGRKPTYLEPPDIPWWDY